LQHRGIENTEDSGGRKRGEMSGCLNLGEGQPVSKFILLVGKVWLQFEMKA
jgi:hypothetical protein